MISLLLIRQQQILQGLFVEAIAKIAIKRYLAAGGQFHVQPYILNCNVDVYFILVRRASI